MVQHNRKLKYCELNMNGIDMVGGLGKDYCVSQFLQNQNHELHETKSIEFVFSYSAIPIYWHWRAAFGLMNNMLFLPLSPAVPLILPLTKSAWLSSNWRWSHQNLIQTHHDHLMQKQRVMFCSCFRQILIYIYTHTHHITCFWSHFSLLLTAI